MAVGGGILAVIGGTGDGIGSDKGNIYISGVEMSEVWEMERLAAGAVYLLPLSAPLRVGIESSFAEEPLSEPASDVPPEPLSSVEAAICGYPWECGTALRVAACESGPDFIAGYNASGHAGTFQISPIHAWRFSARGLDFWTDATVLGWNLDVAYEIWTERWWYAWSCF